MKISPSPTPTPTPTPTPNFTNTQKPTPGCLSGVIRQLLCSTLPTQSSHTEEDFSQNEEPFPPPPEMTKASIDSPSPNIVARLMGLDSMPVFDWIPRTPDLITRSRSANSLHNWVELDPSLRSHRRVRTTLSFRETPTFLQQENADFLLLSFGAGNRETLPKSATGLREMKQRKADSDKSPCKENMRGMQSEKKKQSGRGTDSCREKVSEERALNRPCRVEGNCRKNKNRKESNRETARVGRSSQSTSIRYNVISDETKFKSEKKVELEADKKVELESSSENSSPVSVLDHHYDADADVLVSAEEHSSPINLKSRTKLSSRIQTSNLPFSQVDQVSISGDTKVEMINQKVREMRKLDHELPSFSKLWGEICHLAAEDANMMNWVRREWEKLEDFEEIGTGFELQIMDSLLREVVVEFLQLVPAL